ncbi:aminobutyraldehyde dehydrogenase [Arthrobacter rhombi]
MQTSSRALPPVVRNSGAAPTVNLPPAGQFIGGHFVASEGGKTEIFRPATGEVITTVCAGVAADVDKAVAAAQAAQPAWGVLTPRERSETLHKVADAIEANAETLMALESLNAGKPQAVVEDDVESAVDTFRFMAGACRSLTSMAAGDYVQEHTSVILREPVGVIGVVTPWNYPLLMAVWKLAPILAAGNAVILKPSEQTPLSTLKLAEITAQILPPGLLNVVTGFGLPVGNRLAEHPDIDMVALTGSVGSGSAVAAAAAPSRKRVHLELGGKAPVIVFADADLAAVARAVREAGFWNSGQECGAACRVLVQDSVADEFTAALAREVEQITVGDPAGNTDVELGPLVSKEHFDRVAGFLERALAGGLRAVTGGGPLPGAGYFIAPTVLADVPAGAEASTNEIFGPVVTVETFVDEDEAIRRANETQYGLSASVWTSNAQRSMRFPRLLDFGTVWVNSHLELANELPWGGFKGSGYGRDLSLYALDDFSRTKHVMFNHGG